VTISFTIPSTAPALSVVIVACASGVSGLVSALGPRRVPSAAPGARRRARFVGGLWAGGAGEKQLRRGRARGTRSLFCSKERCSVFGLARRARRRFRPGQSQRWEE
jgi:hypothetical protein